MKQNNEPGHIVVSSAVLTPKNRALVFLVFLAYFFSHCSTDDRTCGQDLDDRQSHGQ